MVIQIRWSARGWRLGKDSHTVLSSMVGSHSSHKWQCPEGLWPGQNCYPRLLTDRPFHLPMFLGWVPSVPAKQLSHVLRSPGSSPPLIPYCSLQEMHSPCPSLSNSGGLRCPPQPASSGETAIPQWPFWDPWHRDQQDCSFHVCACLASSLDSGPWAKVSEPPHWVPRDLGNAWRRA